MRPHFIRTRCIGWFATAVFLSGGLAQAQAEEPTQTGQTEQPEVLEAGSPEPEPEPEPEPKPKPGGEGEASLQARWEAVMEGGLEALNPEVTEAVLVEAQSKGLWELELDVRYWIGHRAFFYEGPEAAHLHWRFLTDLEPDDVTRSHVSRAHNSIGLIYMLQSEWITARDHYRLALQLASPDQRNQPRINLANTEIQLGDWRSAVRSYARALEEATPREAFACMMGLCGVCLEVKLLDAARALLAAAQALLDDPEIDAAADVGPWSQYALDEKACRLLLEAGAFRAAEHALEELRRNVPFEDLAWTSRQAFAEMLAELALKTGRPEHVLATLDENRLLNPEHSATQSEWMLRSRAQVALGAWEPAWDALEHCDPDQLSTQSQGFEDYWTLLGQVAEQTERTDQAALAARRIEQAQKYGAQVTRSDLRSTFTLPGLEPYVGHLAVPAPRGADDTPNEPGDAAPIGANPIADSNASYGPGPAHSVDRRLWLLNGAGLAALLLVAVSWWVQLRRSRELDRLQAALDVLEDARLEGRDHSERQDASRLALQATLDLLDLGLEDPVVTPEWGSDEGDLDRMLELAGDCLRLHRQSMERTGAVRVRSDIGQALLSSARHLEHLALERGVALKFGAPKEPVVWNIPDRDLARLLQRLLPLAIEAAEPESSLRFDLRSGPVHSTLTVDVERPGSNSRVLARMLDGSGTPGVAGPVPLQDIRVLVLQRVARMHDADLALRADPEVWRLELTWPTPAQVPSS